jgi:hypothetical protein
MDDNFRFMDQNFIFMDQNFVHYIFLKVHVTSKKERAMKWNIGKKLNDYLDSQLNRVQKQTGQLEKLETPFPWQVGLLCDEMSGEE